MVLMKLLLKYIKGTESTEKLKELGMDLPE